jgi:hypothetical protein
VVRALALLLLGSCSYVTDTFSTNGFSGDQFPFPVEVDDGAIVVGMQPDGDTIHTAALDIMSPFTVIDHGTDAAPTITDPNITLLGVGTDGMLDAPRARVLSQQLLTLHPCTSDACAVGTMADPHPINAIVGMNSFVSDALRLDLANDQIFILPDIAGSEADLSAACQAVMPVAFRGGGTLLVGGTEVPFVNWRIPIDTCFSPNPDPNAQRQSDRGVDMLLVASTSIGVSLLGQAAYDRYREFDMTALPSDQLPVGDVFLPSGLVAGHVAIIPTMALVANSVSSPRAPCRQVYASHLLAAGNCTDPANSDECPCFDPTQTPHNKNIFCPVPAIVELAPAGGLPMLVIDDSDPTLQALRAELHPNEPEIDGILGTSAVQSILLDVDYPHTRLVARCSDSTTCAARPELAGTTSSGKPDESGACQRLQIDNCLGLPPIGDCR